MADHPTCTHEKKKEPKYHFDWKVLLLLFYHKSQEGVGWWGREALVCVLKKGISCLISIRSSTRDTVLGYNREFKIGLVACLAIFFVLYSV